MTAEWRRSANYLAAKADAIKAHAEALERHRLGKLLTPEELTRQEKRDAERMAEEMAGDEMEGDSDGTGAIYSRHGLTPVLEIVLSAIKAAAVGGVVPFGPRELHRRFPESVPRQCSEHLKHLNELGFIRASGNAKRFKIEVL